MKAGQRATYIVTTKEGHKDTVKFMVEDGGYDRNGKFGKRNYGLNGTDTDVQIISDYPLDEIGIDAGLNWEKRETNHGTVYNSWFYSQDTRNEESFHQYAKKFIAKKYGDHAVAVKMVHRIG